MRREQHRRLSRFYAMPPEERARAAAGDSFLAAANTPRNAGFFSFIAGLDPEQLAAIGRGRRLEIPTAELATAQRDFIRQEFARADLLGRPGVEGPDELGHVRIHADRDGTIYLGLGAVGSHGVLGGIELEQRLRETELQRWLGTSETRSAPGLPVPAPGEPARPEELSVRGETLDRLLEWLTQQDPPAVRLYLGPDDRPLRAGVLRFRPRVEYPPPEQGPAGPPQ